MLKILIIGSSGFIATHVIHRLLNGNIKNILIWGIDKTESIIKNTNRFKIFKQNIQNDQAIKELLCNFNPDFILYTASIKDSSCNQHPNRCININIKALRKFLKLLPLCYKKSPIFIYTSSALVYGKPQSLPITESHAIAPATTYAKTKHQAENIIRKLASKYIILRLFPISGTIYDISYFPNQRTFIEYSVSQAKNNEPINIFNSLNLIRSYLHIEDLSKIIELLLMHPTNCINDIFNISGNKYTLKDITDELKHIHQKDIKLKLIKKNNTYSIYGNMDKLQNKISLPQLNNLTSIIKSVYEHS